MLQSELLNCQYPHFSSTCPPQAPTSNDHVLNEHFFETVLRLESLTERVAKSLEVSRILTKFLHSRSKYLGVNQVLASVP